MTRRDIMGTALTHDPSRRCGSVLLDDGTVLDYAAPAFDAGGLLRLRPGQRVRLRLDGDGVVAAVTLSSFPLG